MAAALHGAARPEGGAAWQAVRHGSRREGRVQEGPFGTFGRIVPKVQAAWWTT
ncbi:hypothetical protein [Streptomyces sp. NPDC055506]